MAFGPTRPPVTEDVAGVIAKDIKSGEGRSLASEVPLAFQTPGARTPVDPAVIHQTRKQMLMFGSFAVGLLVILLVVWAMA